MSLHAPDFVSILFEQEVAVAMVPPRRIRLGLAVAPAETRRLLLIGGPMRPIDRSELRRRGCRVDVVQNFEDALAQMQRERYELIAISAHVQGEADGLRFVRGFKHVSTKDLDSAEGRLAKAYARVPFVVLPLEGKGEYAVFRTLEQWYLGDTRDVPLVDAMLSFHRPV